MATNGTFNVDKPALRALLHVLGECGQVTSVFLKPQPPVKPSVRDEALLADFVACEAFQLATVELGKVAPNVGRYSLLNKFEFEGSLISVVLQGGCHRAKSNLTEGAVRSLVGNAIASVFPAPFDGLHVFRMDDEKWCELTAGATVSSSYIAWQSARSLWWVLCVADFD